MPAHASLRIAAPPDAVWSVLADLPGYGAWNTTVKAVVGKLEVGERLTIEAPPRKGRSFQVKVETLTPPTGMTWAAGLPLGVFVVRRVFRLVAVDGGTEVTLSEEPGGPLKFLLAGTLPDMTEGLREFVECLKRRCEGR